MGFGVLSRLIVVAARIKMTRESFKNTEPDDELRMFQHKVDFIILFLDVVRCQRAVREG